MYDALGDVAMPAAGWNWPTIAAWKEHVGVSGGVVTRMPPQAAAAKSDAGKLAARYGGAGTRYPAMAPVYVLAERNIQELDAKITGKDAAAIDANGGLTSAPPAGPKSTPEVVLDKVLWGLGGIAAILLVSSLRRS